MLAVDDLKISGYNNFEIQLNLYSFKVLLVNNENSANLRLFVVFTDVIIFFTINLFVNCVLMIDAINKHLIEWTTDWFWQFELKLVIIRFFFKSKDTKNSDSNFLARWSKISVTVLANVLYAKKTNEKKHNAKSISSLNTTISSEQNSV